MHFDEKVDVSIAGFGVDVGVDVEEVLVQVGVEVEEVVEAFEVAVAAGVDGTVGADGDEVFREELGGPL